MEITEIKSQLTIEQVLTHYALQSDKNHMLCCPFHADKTPSLQIYPKTNTFCCFSSNCSAGSGDVIDFIQLKERCNPHEAINKAKVLLGHLANPSIQQGEQLSRVAILTKYFESSYQVLTKNEAAKDYTASRNLNYKTLSMGFSGERVQAKWNAAYKTQAERLGLIKKEGKNYVYHFKNSLVFPLLNDQGHVVSLYGRSIQDPETSSGQAKKHIYLSGERQGLYPRYPETGTTALILTESVIDAATLQQHIKGYTVLALYGTNGFSSSHERVIASLPDLKEVILFLDGDAAGHSAIEKLQTTLQELRKGIIISSVATPEGEDINSLAVNHSGGEAELFNHLIGERQVLFPRNESGTGSSEITSKPKQEVHKATTGKLITENPELLYYTTENLHLTVLGGIKITGLDRLRVTLKIEAFTASRLLPIRHSLDLYHSKQLGDLVRQINEHYELSEKEVHYILADLTGALESYRNSRLEAMKPKKPTKKTLTSTEEKTALDYLKSPDLMLKTLQDITRSGIIGEERNAMITYLAYLSRKREKPLHIMCLGASGSGKTYLQEKVGELIPEEDKLEITMLSENAFYYFGKEELKHKLILIEDLDGAENVLYPLRELQSKRRISKTVTLKDNKGNLKTMTLQVEGPVCVSSCTTREKLYEDNANRCILLYINTGKEQDKKITAYQRSESAGQINRQAEEEIKEQFKNLQRLLRPVKVVNPYAEYIDLPEEVFKPRRTMILLLSFIETITFYHQYQRKITTDHQTGEQYIETTKEDVEKGFNLLRDVLFSKSDELTGACRSFLEKLKTIVAADQPFSQREVREKLRINPNNLKRYLRELLSYGHLQVTGGNRHRGFQYQLTNPKEYDQLKGRIDQQLDEIIKKISRSVGQRGSVAPLTHLTT